MNDPESCPFCHHPAPGALVHEEALVRVLWDGFPVTAGHALVTTTRHVASLFDLDEEELAALWRGVARAREAIEQRHPSPDGYNLGVNVGEAAGQTVGHVHLHVIPRRAGDVDDPTGGVRLVIPDRGNYRRPGFVPRAQAADKS